MDERQRAIHRVDRRESHPVVSQPSQCRIKASLSRMRRAFAGAGPVLPAVFGDDVIAALRGRVDALMLATSSDVPARSERVHSLITWLSAVCEAVEMESEPASRLRVWLDSVGHECEWLATCRAAEPEKKIIGEMQLGEIA